MKEKCKDCKYYEAGEQDFKGSCHRFPPNTRFVIVDPNEWCGEYGRNK